MTKLLPLVRFALVEFAPLIVLLALSSAFGIKVAIAGSVVAILVEAVWRWLAGRAFTRLYLLTSGLALGFGIVDLWAVSPFLLRFEAVATNVATGAAFVFAAFGEKPILQEFAEQRGKVPRSGADIRRFFQFMTLFWAAYFFVKAALYVWLALRLPLAEAAAARSVIGAVSMAAMIAVSTTQGRRMFTLCRRFGWLPAAPEGAAS